MRAVNLDAEVLEAAREYCRKNHTHKYSEDSSRVCVRSITEIRKKVRIEIAERCDSVLVDAVKNGERQAEALSSEIHWAECKDRREAAEGELATLLTFLNISSRVIQAKRFVTKQMSTPHMFVNPKDEELWFSLMDILNGEIVE